MSIVISALYQKSILITIAWNRRKLLVEATSYEWAGRSFWSFGVLPRTQETFSAFFCFFLFFLEKGRKKCKKLDRHSVSMRMIFRELFFMRVITEVESLDCYGQS